MRILRRFGWALAVVILVTAWASYLAISGKTDTVGAEGEARVQVAGSLDPNDFGAILVTLIPIALWLGNRGGFRRVFWYSVAMLLFAGIIPTASRGSLLGICAVALVLIPQSKAYAQLAGLPAYFGLYAASLPPMVAALFGFSPVLVANIS